MNFSTNGLYTISSNSTMDTYGFIYNNSFDRLIPNNNLLTWDNDRAGNKQFQMLLNFTATYNYILVLTTYTGMVFGSFSVIVWGPGEVGFSLMVEPGMSRTNACQCFLTAI
jgi:hypothetical protein